MEYVILALLVAAIVLLIVLLTRKPAGVTPQELDSKLTALRQGMTETTKALGDSNLQSMEQLSRLLQENQKTAAGQQTQQLAALTESLREQRAENKRQLDEIRGVVDEKLQTALEKRLTESFKTVSQQLEQVYKGLGEMQSLAGEVGGLKKVLTGVKTRGILGEIQLGAILEEILAPEQYETNVATVPGSTERVEFAVKLPNDGGSVVYLPIDSKFPGDRYSALLTAQESGDRAAADAAYKELERVIKQEARDIRTKYVSVPYTTQFGIMFLPFEGLYAEVVNRGLVETLQREYQINVAGPSTMAALLNSLQMGFRTLAIQKRSNEVWEVLGAVKTEFENFEEILKKAQNHLRQTSDDLEMLIGRRSNAIRRKLRDVQSLDESQSRHLLEDEKEET